MDAGTRLRELVARASLGVVVWVGVGVAVGGPVGVGVAFGVGVGSMRSEGTGNDGVLVSSGVAVGAWVAGVVAMAASTVPWISRVTVGDGDVQAARNPATNNHTPSHVNRSAPRALRWRVILSLRSDSTGGFSCEHRLAYPSTQQLEGTAQCRASGVTFG